MLLSLLLACGSQSGTTDDGSEERAWSVRMNLEVGQFGLDIGDAEFECEPAASCSFSEDGLVLVDADNARVDFNMDPSSTTDFIGTEDADYKIYGGVDREEIDPSTVDDQDYWTWGYQLILSGME